jgi:predicted DCC family thiol-disulfide oxidoreductase YuxK
MVSSEHMAEGKKIIVVYDGTCPMCSAVADKVSTSSQGDSFSLATGAKDEMKLVDEDGKEYGGSQAIAKLLESYPRYRWLGKAMGLPVIKQAAALGYKIVAANRHRIFKGKKA